MREMVISPVLLSSAASGVEAEGNGNNRRVVVRDADGVRGNAPQLRADRGRRAARDGLCGFCVPSGRMTSGSFFAVSPQKM